MHRGTRQNQRMLHALRPGYFQPDALDLAARIRLSLAHAALLRFDTGTGADSGTWDEALWRDETVVLADLSAFPLLRIQQDFLPTVDWDREDRLWLGICKLISRYDQWCQHLLASDADGVSNVGVSMLGQVRQGLGALLSQAVRIWPWPFEPLHSDWQVQPSNGEDDTALSSGEGRQLLRRTWLGLCQAIARVQPLARAQLQQSLSTGKHDPAIGLLLATLQLFQYSRQPINRFPERLTDFYFRDVLHMQSRAPSIERVHLLLERDASDSVPVRIDAGTRFIGGKDAAGCAIEFAADQALDVNNLRVAALYSLYVERDPLISPEREFDFSTRLKVDALPLQPPQAAYQASPSWWPLLGGQSKTPVADLSMGLAVASPLLALREGQREISLVMQLAHPADNHENLRSVLNSPEPCTLGWLVEVFGYYAEYEEQYFPPRPRPGVTQTQIEPTRLAQQAWGRSSAFGDDVHLCFLLARCLATTEPGLFSERLGRLFAAWLIAARETLRESDLAALQQHAQTLEGYGPRRSVQIDDPLILIYSAGALPDRALIFERVFAGAWRASLSSAKGWLDTDSVFMHRKSGDETGNYSGVCIELALKLGGEQPAIVACKAGVHGAQWPELAVLQLRLQTQTRMFAYGLLQQWMLSSLILNVAVSGVRNVVLYNQLGRLDPSKPFLPFGPVPGRNAYLLWGCAELGAKPLQSVRMNIKWSDLPSAPGGFAEHYAAYSSPPDNESFKVRASILMDGQWQSGSGPMLPLFPTPAGEHGIPDLCCLSLPAADLRRWHRVTLPPSSGQDYQFDLHSRNNFFRFELQEPAHVFGHAEYPKILTEVLTQNARKKRPQALPKEPYTPTIESLTIDYRASQVLPVRQEGRDAQKKAGEAVVFQLHPFGLQPIQTTSMYRHPNLLPRYSHDGNLYIGLAGTDPQGALSLFFHLRKEEAAERWRDVAPQLAWAVWTDAGWQELKPFQLLSDGTQGMLRSGIVQLHLPTGMSRDCPMLPGQLFWLRLSAHWGFEQLAGLYGVHAQALCASRIKPAGPTESLEPLPPGTIRQPLQSVAGLAAVTQVGPSFGRQGADPAELWLTRSSERLRHKQRAVTIWDYERLLLDAFPEAYKVKCFPHQLPTRRLTDDPANIRSEPHPGHVLLVVVPAPCQGHLFSSTEAPRLDAATLDAMTHYLRERSPAGIHLVVRNVAYEQIQVRCKVRLTSDAHPGTSLRKINQTLIEYLSPWHDTGCGADFDWQINAEALESHLRAQPYIAGVGGLSLLHVVCSDDRFHVLHDTARQSPKLIAAGARMGLSQVSPELPWSLALPVKNHLIELADQPADMLPQATGISLLEVGKTFIVGRTNRGAGQVRI